MPTARLGASRWPPSAFSAAFIATVVGFGGTLALVVQAGQAIDATPLQVVSMVTALCLGKALAGAGLSLWLRMPIVLAWSTPGAALVAANTLGLDYATAVGTFVAAAAMMVTVGLVPALGRLVARIPGPVASAMLAGILLPFCLGLFRSFASDAVLAVVLLLIFLVARLRFPTYAMLLVLLATVAAVLLRGDLAGWEATGVFGTLQGVVPVLDWRAIVSLGLPLFLVTLVGQNLPGLVVLRSAGYAPPPRAVLGLSGLATLLMAPFGAHGINLAAITAAICTGDDAHADPTQRWRVGLLYAGFYLLLALFATPLVGLFLAMPPGVIAILAGLALLGPLSQAMGNMLGQAEQREAAVLTFVATASGLSLLGIGSAFWGLLTGFLVLGLRRWLGGTQH